MRTWSIRSLVIAALVSASATVTGAESPVQGLKQRMQQPAEVLVLASTHLEHLDGVTAGHADALVDVLSGFAPQAVVVEALPAHTIEAMHQQADLHGEALDAFVGKRFIEAADESRRTLEVDAAGARKSLASECSAAIPETSHASLRCMQLAAAAWDKPWFDYLGWQHGRRWPHDLPQGSVGRRVAELVASTNENQLIGARLSGRLGLARVHGMDDHPGADLYGPVFDALLPAIGDSKAYAAFQASARTVKEAGERAERAVAADNLLPFYLWLNGAMYGELVLDEEWRLFVDRDLPRAPGQARIALWDVRNLAMVSNILRVVSRHPGQRIVVIVGASHKPFFDDYLDRSIGVRVRQLEEFTTRAPPVGGTTRGN